MPHVRDIFLAIAAIPFIYYLIAIYSSWRYFRQPASAPDPSFTPPVSILKPFGDSIRTHTKTWPVSAAWIIPSSKSFSASIPTTRRFSRCSPDSPPNFRTAAFASCTVRDVVAANDKVAKLARLVSEAAHEVVVISDSDVRVRPDYLRHVTAPLRDPKVGAVTCLYVPIEITTLTDHLQSVGMMSDFYAGVLVDWQLEGMKFALGTDHRHHAHAPQRIRRLSRAGKPPRRRSSGRPPHRRAGLQGGAAPLCHRYRLRLRVDQRFAPQATAVDRRDASYAPVGTSGPAADAGIAVVARGGGDSSLGGGRRRLPRRLSGVADGDDLDDRDSRPASVRPVETDAAASGLGCRGVRYLADQFQPQQHPVARRRLLHPGRSAGSGAIRQQAPRRPTQPAFPLFFARRFARAGRTSPEGSREQNSLPMPAPRSSAAPFAPAP